MKESSRFFVKKRRKKLLQFCSWGVATTTAPPQHPTVMPAKAGIHAFYHPHRH